MYDVSTSTLKRLVVYHIGRLQDKNPQVRLKAISELALLGDAEALDALQNVFKNDPDVEVRRAAQEAGRSIFLKQQNPKN
jgi:HEAT repeat protein